MRTPPQAPPPATKTAGTWAQRSMVLYFSLCFQHGSVSYRIVPSQKPPKRFLRRMTRAKLAVLPGSTQRSSSGGLLSRVKGGPLQGQKAERLDTCILLFAQQPLYVLRLNRFCDKVCAGTCACPVHCCAVASLRSWHIAYARDRQRVTYVLRRSVIYICAKITIVGCNT